MTQKQQGVTLISLMVGLLISMIAVAGMLLIFRNSIQVTTDATAAASADGERISALLRAHMLIQKAGFGIPDAAPDTDLVEPAALTWVQNSASLQTTYNGDSVIWSSDTDQDGNILCEGIVPTDDGGLKWISASCSHASDWATVQNWTASDLAGSSVPGVNAIALDLAIDDTASCSPVGAGNATTDILRGFPVTFTLTLSTGVNVSNSTCIYNFSATNP